MQLEGILSRFALRELLELSVASLITGAIEVQAPSGVYRIFINHGTCVHATSPDASGFDAIWPLFELSDAPFRFVAGLLAAERTIAEPALQVIDKAEALARQWSTIRPHIPNLGMVPSLVMPANGEQVRIFEEDWPVLSCVDGTRTIAEVAQRAVLEPIQVCTALLRLRDRGLVELDRHREIGRVEPCPDPAPLPAPVAPRESYAAAESARTARPSFFTRLLTAVPETALDQAPTAAQPPVAAIHLPASAGVAEQPVEYDDILRLLRS